MSGPPFLRTPGPPVREQRVLCDRIAAGIRNRNFLTGGYSPLAVCAIASTMRRGAINVGARTSSSLVSDSPSSSTAASGTAVRNTERFQQRIPTTGGRTGARGQRHRSSHPTWWMPARSSALITSCGTPGPPLTHEQARPENSPPPPPHPRRHLDPPDRGDGRPGRYPPPPERHRNDHHQDRARTTRPAGRHYHLNGSQINATLRLTDIDNGILTALNTPSPAH